MMFAEYKGFTLSALRRYLEGNNWVLDSSYKNKNINMYLNQLSDDQIALPASENLRDYAISINNSLNALSTIEGRDITNILSDIVNICFDKIEFRVISDSTINGTIPLDYAAECVDGIKDLVLYSAAADLRNSPICSRPSIEAYNTLRAFNFAQTSIGSFVFNVDAQVVDEDREQLSIIEGVVQKSKNRKVVQRIQTAFDQITRISSGKEQLSFVAQDAYITGITANMCEALIKIRPNEWEATLETTFRYAEALKTYNIPLTKNVSLFENDFLIISELYKFYKNEKLIESVTLTGNVRSLSKRGIKDTDEFEKVIRLQANYKDQERTIRIELSDDQYIIACNAHRDGVEVKVAGDLDMSSRLWSLSNIQYFIQLNA